MLIRPSCLTPVCIATTGAPYRRSKTPRVSLCQDFSCSSTARTSQLISSTFLRVYARREKHVTRVKPLFRPPQTGGCSLIHCGQLALHSTEGLLALTPARPIWSHGSLAQFLKSCSIAMWRTWSWDAKESFSCTATESSSKTSERKSKREGGQSINQWFELKCYSLDCWNSN